MPEDQESPLESEEVSQPGAMFDAALQSSFLPPWLDWVPPTTTLLERELPQFENLSFVARGGMGAVYRACQKSLNRSVAIKVLPQEISQSNWDYSHRFRQEAEAMAHLSHPHIVSIFDAGETSSGLLYFVMEFIDGTDVRRLLAKEGKLPPTRALEITSMVCDALHFAHGHGVIHRDIKPSNVMLDQQSRTKVADFGLAKLLDKDHVSTYASSQLAMGTVNYIAPEALVPGTKLDHRADVYAVGVMLYNMITGKVPHGRFEMPSVLLPEVDQRLDSIIDRAMRMDREKRYASAAEIKEEVNEILENPGSSRSSARSAATTLPAPKSPSRVYAAVMAVPVLAVLAVATFILAPKSPRPKETMQSAPPTPSLIDKATPESGAPVPAYKDRLILPTGVWIPVKVDKDYAAVNGGELTPEGGIKLSHGVILLDAAHREFFARDVAVRVHLLSTEHTTASSLVVRQVGPRGRKLVFAPHFTQLSHYPTSREAWSAPVPHDESLGLDHPVTLEIAAIGSATYGLVDGKLMPPVLADEPSEKGSVLVGSLDGEFRDVEIMILDNIPAEKATLLAGVPRAAQALPNK